MTTAGQLRNGYPAFRVFVFGVEVTADVLDVKVTLNDSRAPSVASFTLASKAQDANGNFVNGDRYVIEAADIAALNLSNLPLSELEMPDTRATLATLAENIGSALAQANPFDAASLALETNNVMTNAVTDYLAATEETSENINRLLQERVQDGVADIVKSRVLQAKIKERVAVEQPPLTVTGEVQVTSAAQLAWLRGEAFRYSFQEGDCIFQSNDPVRIFMRDPFNPRVWFYMFTGFVSGNTDHVSQNNDGTVTIQVEDVTRILRYARITTNPGLFDIDAVKQQEDSVIRTFYNEDGLTELTLPEFMYTILFGSDVAGTTNQLTAGVGETIQGNRYNYKRVSVNGSTDSTASKDGCGSFTYSRSLTLVMGRDANVPETGPITAVQQREVQLLGANALAVYQAIVDHQVRASDLESMVLEGQTPVSRAGLVKDALTGDVRVDEVIRTIGENPHLYPVDAGRLLLLLPASIGPSSNRNLLIRDLIQSVATQTTYRSRLAMINDVLARIEFSFYSSPKGDLLCEMPLYDFEPKDFGTEPVTRTDIAQAFAGSIFTPEQVGIVFDSGESRGPFAPHYQIARRDTIRSERTFDDEKIRTQFATTWNVIGGYPSIGKATDVLGQAPQVTTLRALVPQFGVRFEKAEPTSFISSPEAAQLYSNLKLNQWNADARSSQTEAIPQLRLWPNRPVLHTVRNYIGTVRNVSWNITWNSSFDMSFGVNYQRGWSGQRDESGRLLYAPLGGFASRALNYAALFGIINPSESASTPSTNPAPVNAPGAVNTLPSATQRVPR